MKCHNCGAPLLTGRPRCSYCGTIADLDLMGKHRYTTESPEQPRSCPDCGSIMQTVNVATEGSPFLIERCEKCLGLFFDPGELDSMIEHHIRAIFTIDRIALAGLAEYRPQDEVRYRKCPVCQKIMNRVNFGESSGVIVDQCRDHGVYLDAGELHHILKWVRSGGALHSKQESNARLAAEIRQKELRKTEFEKTPMPIGNDRKEEDLMDKIAEFVLSLFGSPKI